MIVICDSSFLINLSLINQLRLLNEMYGEVLIPPGVYDEVVGVGVGRIGSEEVQNSEFIRIVELDNPDSVDDCVNDALSRTDAEVIALAKEQKADLIITRDNRLRKYARQKGLNAIDTFTFFIEAKRVGVITAVKPMLDEIKSKGVLVRDGVYQEILRQAGELI
jgi:predicted nucleic acid-binding protein